MTARRCELTADRHAGGKVQVRVDDDFPVMEFPVELYVDEGVRAMTPDQADEVAQALIRSAQEARENKAAQDRIPGEHDERVQRGLI